MSTPSDRQTTQSHPPQTLAKQTRTRKAWDVALSIVLLVLSYTAFLIGALFAVFSVAFIDYCPDPCHADTAAGAQVVAGIVVAIVALLGTIATIVLLVLRRRAWWAAAATLLLVVIGWIAGFIGYAVALSAT